MSDRIKLCLDENRSDRRGLLNGMAWAGTGAVWAVCGGALTSPSFGQLPHHDATRGNSSFVQLREAVAKSNALDPSRGSRWSSFDYRGVHFVALVVDSAVASS